MKNLAPIVLFVFNRPEHTRRTVESLKQNLLASESELFVYSDGPRNKKDEVDVAAVRALVDALDGFKRISIYKNPVNNGLAGSVIAGITEVIQQHGKVIAIEDDLQFSPYFLNYMNEALNRNKDDPEIFSIGGYSPPLEMPENYTADSYLSYRCCTWGWATWRDRWDKVDWEVEDFDGFIKDESMVARFNRGGDDMSHILKLQMAGKVSSWGIRWDYAHFKNDAYCFRPAYSIVGNTGNDGTGVHCGATDKFNVTINTKSMLFPPKHARLQLNVEINNRFATFYDGRSREGAVSTAPISRRAFALKKFLHGLRLWSHDFLSGDPNKFADLVVVSGIPAGDSGTGRLVAHLQERMAELAGGRIKLIARPERPARWQIQLWLRGRAYRRAAMAVFHYALKLSRFWFSLCGVWLKRNQILILLHPQNLGYRMALRLLDSRDKSSLIYLLDSSFFCVASYNHLKGVSGACLLCLEKGFDQVSKNGCKPFPRLDWSALEFAPRLQELVKAGRVNVAAQNLRQAELAKRQFGLVTIPRVVGLWTQDWDEVFSEKTWCSQKETTATNSWDVLFHGHCLDAKGVSWVSSVAELCPELRFMFPFLKPDWFVASANCSFVPCTWETGLRGEMDRSWIVVVPSLWSAPIEGSLVKSIACADAVAVVNNTSSYCDELPDELLLKLSENPSVGAEELRCAYRSGWRPDANVRACWLGKFAKNKRTFVPDLLDVALDFSSRSR